jgi:hypothetical protein
VTDPSFLWTFEQRHRTWVSLTALSFWGVDIKWLQRWSNSIGEEVSGADDGDISDFGTSMFQNKAKSLGIRLEHT